MHPLSGQFGAFWGYLGGSAVKNIPTAQEIARNAGDMASIPGHLHIHHSNKDTEPFHHPRNFPHIPLPLIATPSILDGHRHVKEIEFQTNKTVQYARFSIWLFLLSRMFLYLSTLLTVSVVHSLFITNKYSIIWIYQNLFIYAHIDGCLGHIHLGAIMNCTVVCKSLYKHMLSFLLGKCPGVELLGHMIKCTLNFIRNCQTIFPK